MSARLVRPLAGAFVVVLVAAASFWAGRTTLREPERVTSDPTADAVVQVVDKELGRVLTLAATVSRDARPLAPNALTGVVTSVHAEREVADGDVLYTVGRTPVVAVEGTEPFWRDLGPGASGRDVAQLTRMLRSAGQDLAQSSRWDASTTSAVRAWQKKLGAEVTGTVPLGHLVAVPTLPTSVVLDDDVLWPGAVLRGGETVASVSAGDPRFTLEVSQSQAGMIPVGTKVLVHGDDDEWEALVAESVPLESSVALRLTASDGGLVCGEDCAAMPAGDKLSYLSDVRIVEPAKGPVVPVAAIATRADGTTWVTVVAGGTPRDVQVEIQTVAQGLAVVTGVTAGDSVKVFGGSGTATPAPGGSTGPAEGASTEPGGAGATG